VYYIYIKDEIPNFYALSIQIMLQLCLFRGSWLECYLNMVTDSHYYFIHTQVWLCVLLR
jgi:hypothetical protein